MNKDKLMLDAFYAYIYERFIEEYPEYYKIYHTWTPTANSKDWEEPTAKRVLQDALLYSITIKTKTDVFTYVYQGSNNTKLIKGEV